MNKDELVKLGLTEEQATMVTEKYVNMVPQGRFNEIVEEKNSLKSQLAERDKQLKELEKSVGDNKELKAQIEKLQTDNKTAAEKYAKD